MNIFCCACDKEVQARLTDGYEIYPHRDDLWDLPFWKCDTCGNYVGCHHKVENAATEDRTRPLGVIPTPEVRAIRREIHDQLDPLWRSRYMQRRDVYAQLDELLGCHYHTANIKSVAEGEQVLQALGILWDRVRANERKEAKSCQNKSTGLVSRLLNMVK